MDETKAEKQHDVLDDIKLAEKQMKMALLVKNLKSLKEIAKDVLIQKEKMVRYLEAMGMNETEQKRVIDFINSLVTLTKSDKEDIQDEIEKELDDSKAKIEKKMDEDPFKSLGLTTTSLNGSSFLQNAIQTWPNPQASAGYIGSVNVTPSSTTSWNTSGSGAGLVDYTITASNNAVYLMSNDGTQGLKL